MEVKEIETLIIFHQDGLDLYRQHMSPSAQYLEEQTIKALKDLKKGVELTISLIRESEKAGDGH